MDPIKFRFGFISLLSKLELKLKRNYHTVFGEFFWNHLYTLYLPQNSFLKTDQANQNELYQ